MIRFSTLKHFCVKKWFRVFHDAHFCVFWRTFGPNDPNNYHYCVMVDAKLCAQHLLLKWMIQIDVSAICYLRVSTTRTWVRIADIGDETVDCVSVQFFASKRQTLCIIYWYAINQSTKMSQSKLMSFFSSATEKRKRDSDDSAESQPGPSTPKKTSRPRGFCDDWLVKYDWLYLENGKMKCHPCVNTRQNNPFSAFRVARTLETLLS